MSTENIMLRYDCGCSFSFNLDRQVETTNLCKGHFDSFHVNEIMIQHKHKTVPGEKS